MRRGVCGPGPANADDSTPRALFARNRGQRGTKMHKGKNATPPAAGMPIHSAKQRQPCPELPRTGGKVTLLHCGWSSTKTTGMNIKTGWPKKVHSPLAFLPRRSTRHGHIERTGNGNTQVRGVQCGVRQSVTHTWREGEVHKIMGLPTVVVFLWRFQSVTGVSKVACHCEGRSGWFLVVSLPSRAWTVGSWVGRQAMDPRAGTIFNSSQDYMFV